MEQHRKVIAGVGVSTTGKYFTFQWQPEINHLRTGARFGVLYSVDPVPTPQKAASDQGLYCLPRGICMKYTMQV